MKTLVFEKSFVLSGLRCEIQLAGGTSYLFDALDSIGMKEFFSVYVVDQGGDFFTLYTNSWAEYESDGKKMKTSYNKIIYAVYPDMELVRMSN